MGLDIYFGDDISNRLDGIGQTAQHLEPGDFQAGFVACLSAVRASFGLPQSVVVIPAAMLPELSESRGAQAATSRHKKGRYDYTAARRPTS